MGFFVPFFASLYDTICKLFLIFNPNNFHKTFSEVEIKNCKIIMDTDRKFMIDAPLDMRFVEFNIHPWQQSHPSLGQGGLELHSNYNSHA